MIDPGENIVNDLIKEHDKKIWNAAIDAAIEKLKKDFFASQVVIEIIKQVKK